MPPVVLLRHLPPDDCDGPSHYDWLLAPSDGPMDPDERALLSFRVAGRIDEFAPGHQIEAQRIADHRWRYLEYEGEISQGRGSVERVAEGIWTPRSIEDALISGEITWSGQAPVFIEGRRGDLDRWVFQISAPHGR